MGFSIRVVEGKPYWLKTSIRSSKEAQVPRLVIVSYLPNEQAKDVLESTIQAIQKITALEHELWVVDHCSPWKLLKSIRDGGRVNWIYNRTLPLPPGPPAWGHYWGFDPSIQIRHGSYANGLGVELALRFIPESTRYLMTLHSDICPVHRDWLRTLRDKIDEGFAVAGVRLDRFRHPEGVLHILGCMVDLPKARRLGLDYLPNIPHWDAGDWMTIGLRDSGEKVYAFPNTYVDPELEKTLSPDSPFCGLPVDRTLNEKGEVIFLHLGRGTLKSLNGGARGLTQQEWVSWVREMILQREWIPFD